MASKNLRAITPWFYTAAINNLIWGIINIVKPTLLFELLMLDPPSPIAASCWNVCGGLFRSLLVRN